MRKILFVGSSSDTIVAINHCKELGVYTILTDYIPVEKSKAKRLVDEYWMYNVSDIDNIENKCREASIDAVYAGNSEFCLDCTKELAKRLNLPFYANDIAWEATRNKAKFKEYCEKVGLCVPKRFILEKPFSREDLDKIEYPVIVKPFDAVASKGCVRCENEKELIEGYDYALSFSTTKNVIVEEFITGVEFAPAFFVVDGKVNFTSIDEIIYSNRKNGNNMLFTYYPSALENRFLSECQAKLQSLCDLLGIKFGNYYFEVMFAKNKFYFLELIYRVDGVGIWSLTEKIQGFNVIKRMVNYSLGLPEPEHTQKLPDCNVGGIYFYWAKPGKIAKIVGREEVKNMKNVEIICDRFNEGDIIEESGSMVQMAFYFSVVAKDKKEYLKKMQEVLDVLKIYDENGKELTDPYVPKYFDEDMNKLSFMGE